MIGASRVSVHGSCAIVLIGQTWDVRIQKVPNPVTCSDDRSHDLEIWALSDAKQGSTVIVAPEKRIQHILVGKNDLTRRI